MAKLDLSIEHTDHGRLHVILEMAETSLVQVLDLIRSAVAGKTDLSTLEKELHDMSQSTSNTLDNLTQQVHHNNDVVDSAITLIQGLAQRISSNVNDPQALMALAQELQQKDEALANAVAANTLADSTGGGAGGSVSGGGADTSGGGAADTSGGGVGTGPGTTGGAGDTTGGGVNQQPQQFRR
jgi:TolA-binding protein